MTTPFREALDLAILAGQRNGAKVRVIDTGRRIILGECVIYDREQPDDIREARLEVLRALVAPAPSLTETPQEGRPPC